ncbi:Tim44/TimA family putative adaptor protein [Falsirhodobacter halotolerans]|uniref:Tim44/TimA family putative adaptor protein n=1 Tax=Falsirhodobacter halotolerans TaxID=1146892 RepID=UPI001FCFD1BB|nr:Tim44/TimA family putative adaptor protein [Falsirhodobacter halotolerans]MCJ8140818.1 Tim44/TimA family putative adaptor protein [Falsirhodobacter halotolerans]
MSSATLIQLLVLAAIAVFLILKLRSVLGTREGFEKPPLQPGEREAVVSGPAPVAEEDSRDITDHVPEGSDSARALMAMKRAEPSFSLSEFLGGARGAYEMILVAFDKGDMSEVRGFIAPDVLAAFEEAIATRRDQGLVVDSKIIGIREVAVNEATFLTDSRIAEITVRFQAEMTTVVTNAAGDIVEGSETDMRRQRDVWTFQRAMGADDPNWRLVATGE